MKNELSPNCHCPSTPRLARRDALLLLAGLAVGANGALAQDVLQVEPRSYKVIFENDKVRALEYTARPGLGVCGAGLHSHPDHVVVALTAAKVKVKREDGTTFIADIEAGATFWDPATTHEAENITGSGTKMILIEIKDKSWKPATG